MTKESAGAAARRASSDRNTSAPSGAKAESRDRIRFRRFFRGRPPGKAVSYTHLDVYKRQMVDIGEEKGAIQAGEKEMIENIFEFDNMTAGDVMIHRTDMVMLWVDDTAEEIAQTIESSGLSRFPVYEEDADDIIGILNTRDWLLNARKTSPRPVRELLRPAYFVPESVRTDKLFRDMQSRKIHLSIVVDEYGGTAGLVTMEDLLEEIVDVYKRQPRYTSLKEPSPASFSSTTSSSSACR